MSTNMENAQDSDYIEISQDHTVKAWVIFSTIPSRSVAAAFYGRAWADKLHKILIDSEPPILMEVDEIPVKIDKYLEYIVEGMTPFTVVLEDGKVSRQDTYESDIFNISEPSFEDGHPEIFAGTFWARSIDEAVDRAEFEWRVKSNQ